MAKKKSLSFLKPTWLPALLIGTGLGVTSQHIPELKAYTSDIIHLTDQQDRDYTPEKPIIGQPISSFHIHRQGYSLAYDGRNRNPAWVYEHLTAENIKGNADRSHSDFKEDDGIPQHLRATLADYRGKGFDRGHMAPAADHRSNQDAMADTFYMTNMCPQCPQFNRGYWGHVRIRIIEHVKALKSLVMA